MSLTGDIVCESAEQFVVDKVEDTIEDVEISPNQILNLEN